MGLKTKEALIARRKKLQRELQQVAAEINEIEMAELEAELERRKKK